MSKPKKAWIHNSLLGRVARAKNFLASISSHKTLTDESRQRLNNLMRDLDLFYESLKERNDA